MIPDVSSHTIFHNSLILICDNFKYFKSSTSIKLAIPLMHEAYDLLHMSLFIITYKVHLLQLPIKAIKLALISSTYYFLDTSYYPFSNSNEPLDPWVELSYPFQGNVTIQPHWVTSSTHACHQVYENFVRTTIT